MALEAEVAVARDMNIGRTIAGRYRIVRRLGGGGMGVVYLAEHTAIGKRVALKMLHAQFATEPEVVRRFLNEARAAALVQHRNIVDALDFGETDEGAPFLVLEYLEGRDLGTELATTRRLSAQQAAIIGAQVASALAAAHAKGIVHRDLKPDNVYLVAGEAEHDAVRVLDFGISKVMEGSGGGGGTKTGTAMGTPHYMAPEQFLDASRVDARSDVYALGVMLYEMISGRLPIEAPSFGAMAIAVMQTRPAPLLDLCPELAPELARLVDGMLIREVDRRVASMNDVLTVLAPLADMPERRSSLASSVTYAEHLPGSVIDTHVARRKLGIEPRSSRTVMVGVAVAATGAVIASLAFFGTRGEPAARPEAPAHDAPRSRPVDGIRLPPLAPAVPVDPPRAMDPPAEIVEPEVVSRAREARERGDVRAAIAALGQSRERREQLSASDLELIAALCEDTLRMAETRLEVGDAAEALRLARLVSGLSLASSEHQRRASQFATAAQARLDAETRATADRVRATREADAVAAAEAARRAREESEREAARDPVRTGRRTRELESENPY